MYWLLGVIMILAVGLAAGDAYSQELQLATFQETAQVLVDRTLTGNVTASITLQSTSNQEILVPSDLNQDIVDNPRIVSVILTNQEGCGVLGVVDESCILVNIARTPEDTNIIKIQDAAKENGDRLIDRLNSVFDTDAEYHSSFLHHRDAINLILETSGAVSGRDVVSAVYTMPQEDTYSMYQKIASSTIAGQIRNAGGFFDVGTAISAHENAHMALSIIPTQGTSLFQIRVATEYGGAEDTNQFGPLEYLLVDSIERSNYFAGGFYPLNSIVQITILSPEQIELKDHDSSLIPTREVDGQTIPTEFRQNGWVFDATSGTKIEAKYLFGTRTSANGDELALTFGAIGDGAQINPGEAPLKVDESIAVVAIIAIFAAAAAGFYLKGYRRGP